MVSTAKNTIIDQKPSMQRAEQGDEMYLGLAKWGREHAAYIEEIYREVAARGPIAASALEGQKGSGGWWGWSHVVAAR